MLTDPLRQIPGVGGFTEKIMPEILETGGSSDYDTVWRTRTEGKARVEPGLVGNSREPSKNPMDPPIRNAVILDVLTVKSAS